jgi:hypothetical protein
MTPYRFQQTVTGNGSDRVFHECSRQISKQL